MEAAKDVLSLVLPAHLLFSAPSVLLPSDLSMANASLSTINVNSLFSRIGATLLVFNALQTVFSASKIPNFVPYVLLGFSSVQAIASRALFIARFVLLLFVSNAFTPSFFIMEFALYFLKSNPCLIRLLFPQTISLLLRALLKLLLSRTYHRPKQDARLKTWTLAPVQHVSRAIIYLHFGNVSRALFIVPFVEIHGCACAASQDILSIQSHTQELYLVN